MEKLAETYRFPDPPRFQKGQDYEKWLIDYVKWQNDFLVWLEKILDDSATKINWLIDHV